MLDGIRDEAPRTLPEEVLRALETYAAFYRRVTGVVMDGATDGEIAELASECFDAAVDLRALATGGDGLPPTTPDVALVLLRELYESLIVLSGIQRVADSLSMPVATGANGDSLRGLLRPKGELAAWYREATGSVFDPPLLPANLTSRERSAYSLSSYLRWARRRPAANADRASDEGAGKADLTRVFASRIDEGMRVYSAAGDGAADRDETTTAARRLAPVLIGFARIAERRLGGLKAPEGSLELARLVADGLVDRAGGSRSDDGARKIGDAAAPLRDWLAPT